MNKALCFFQVILFFCFPIISEGKTRIVIKSNENIQYQLQFENASYVVRNTIDLQGESVLIPEGSDLIFKRKGSIHNGEIIGQGTTFKGKVKLYCTLSGTFLNEVIPVSWLCVSDRTLLSKQISSIFNLNRPCVVKLDNDITMDGTLNNVEYIALSGKKRISNSCRYKVSGDVFLHGVLFDGFESYRELFLDLREIADAVTIDISGICFDGCWNTSRFLYCPYKKIEKASTINISSCYFSKVKNYIIQFRPLCKGSIRDNRFENIGTDEFSNVIGINLGDSSDDEDRLCANGFEITNNIFKDFKVPYNDTDDGREAHAILIYGYNNIIRRNHVINFYSSQMPNGDPGRDCEGIYIKGGNNSIEDNYLDNCVGTTPDGAITAKSNRANNRIVGNTIKHKFGIGIQCYTSNSIIEDNRLFSEQNAEAGIAMARNTGSTIRNNVFTAGSGKEYHSAIAMVNCEGISIIGNHFNNTSCILTTYKSRGKIKFDSNEINLSGLIYGTNTYYTAPFELHDDTAEFVIMNNSIKATGVRSSQLIEAPESFMGSVQLIENSLHIEDSKELQSEITYLVRNVKTLTSLQNKELSKNKKIRSVSNLNNKLTLEK